MGLKPRREIPVAPFVPCRMVPHSVTTCGGTGSTGGPMPRVVSQSVQLIQPITHRDLVSAPQSLRELHLALLSSRESLLGTPRGSS